MNDAVMALCEPSAATCLLWQKPWVPHSIVEATRPELLRLYRLSRSQVCGPLALRFSLATIVGRSGFDASTKVVSTVDKCEMRKCLRKISQLAVFPSIVFFRQKPDIVAQRK